MWININRLSIVVFLVLITNLSSYSQNKSDYNWIFGQNYTDSLAGTEGTVINFDNEERTMRYQPIFPSQAIGNSTAVISDPETGELLFFSNGCTIFDRTFHEMDNGDGINVGVSREYFCDQTQTQWYPYSQGLLIVRDPADIDEYYLIHKETELTTDLTERYNRRILCSKVDMSLNEGKGSVIEKNIEIYDGDDLALGYLTMIPHENQRDWWLVQPKHDSNEFIRMLLTEQGFVDHHTQVIGDSIVGQGQAKYSPDGTMFAAHNGWDDYHLYDFDRSTGLLSNYRSLKFEGETFGLGMEFSPSSRYTYLSRRTEIFQVDNTEEHLEDGLVLIDTLRTASEGLTASFGGAALAPDCKIYISHLSSTRFLTVINNPDEKGDACDVAQRGLRMPYFHFINAIPNFPHFRIDEEDICDPTITNVWNVPVADDAALEVYPNPTNGAMTIWTNASVKVGLYNIHGEQVANYGNINGKRDVDISAMPSGVYFVRYVRKNGAISNLKVMKI